LQKLEAKHRRLTHSAQAQAEIGERNKAMMFRTHELLTREIEERTRTEAALREAMREVEGAGQAKADFLANMSHELRTPMNGVIGMLDLALQAPLDGEVSAFLATARSSAEDLLVLLNDILDVSKIDAGRLELEEVEFAPWDALDDVVAVFASAALPRGIQIEVDVDPSVPDAVRGDPVRFRQVLKNLLSNAVKFTDAGTVTAAARFDSDAQRLKVSVSDTGCGIDPARLGDIFDPFIQADSSTTRRFGGTGLGLSIGRRLARAMGGNLTVTSQLGAGSTFEFTCAAPAAAEPERESPSGRVAVDVEDDVDRRMLTRILGSLGVTVDAETPDVLITDQTGSDDSGAAVQRIRIVNGFAPHRVEAGTLRCQRPLRRRAVAQLLAEAASGTRSASDAPSPATRLFAYRVLIAEDHPVNQILTLRMVERLGCSAAVTADGREAIEALQREDFDVVLMDCQMPELDGYQATGQIRELALPGRQPWIVALTANALAGDRERCIDAGMDDYVSKPVSLDALAEALARVDRDCAGMASTAVKAS
jgi:signal transduction histidine kinase/CheY-like chemotaxis protein